MISQKLDAMRPTYRAYSVLGIDLAFLEEHEITSIVFDVDGCLLPARENRIAPEVVTHIRALANAKIKVWLASNTYEFKRITQLSEQLEIGWKVVYPGWRWWRWKPSPWCILRAMDAGHGNMDPNHTLVVGDRLTDIKAGKRAGCRTLLVEMVGACPWYSAFKVWRGRNVIEYMTAMPGVMPKYIDRPPVVKTQSSDMAVAVTCVQNGPVPLSEPPT